MTRPKDAEEGLNPINCSASSDIQIIVPNIGCGTMRTTATHIAVLLQLDSMDKAVVLVSAAKALGMTLEDIVSEWNDKACRHCGVSVRLHDSSGCP